jgi:sn-glycerol 3-phosphate transport system permease protein
MAVTTADPVRLAAADTAAAPERPAGLKKVHFTRTGLPVALILPQLAILALFFFIPSIRAVAQAFFLVDPFGGTALFVGFDNFSALFASAEYRASAWITAVFVVATTLLVFAVALVLAFATDRIAFGRGAYRTALLVPYAIAPAIAGGMWAFLFNPIAGPVAALMKLAGIAWNPVLVPDHALVLVILAAAWKHLAYNYIFLAAALLGVPRALKEAAAMDGSGPVRRFLDVSLPLITPTIYFLLTMNLVYALFDTFALIDTITRGGPAASTSILVYKVYRDGFVHTDLGSSSAQSVVLMLLALALTLLQFRHLDRKVNYGA